MKFSEIKYQRVDIDKFKSDIDTLVEEFKKANSYDKEKEIFDKVNQIRKNFDTQANIVQIRFSINTQDEFYKKENEYMDKITPLFEESVDNFISAFLESKNLDKFAEDYGSVMVNKFRKLKRVFSKDIIEDLQEENKLSSEYTSILSNMTFEFEGKKLNQESIFAMFSLNEKDRRKAAFETFSREFEKNKEKIQSIYDSLVKVRHKMAKKLGYENFVQMGYDRLLRVDYDKEDVKKYREYIKKYVLDYCIKLNDIRAKHFNLDKIHYYDDELTFLSGDPKPESEYKKLCF